MFWSVLMRTITRYAPFVTIPFAGVIGYIGYHIEDILSDKYTPFSESIQEKRMERLTTDEKIEDVLKTAETKAPAHNNLILDRNLSPSLQTNNADTK